MVILNKDGFYKVKNLCQKGILSYVGPETNITYTLFLMSYLCETLSVLYEACPESKYTSRVG
jgi:hypothetical protein